MKDRTALGQRGDSTQFRIKDTGNPSTKDVIKHGHPCQCSCVQMQYGLDVACSSLGVLDYREGDREKRENRD